MSAILAALGLVGVVGSYEMAERMSRGTRHSVRLAMYVIGGGCLLAMGAIRWPHLRDWALLAVLVGWCLYRLSDQRRGGYVATATRSSGVGDGHPSVACGCPADTGAAPGDAGSRVVAVAGGGADDVRRAA